MNTVPGQQAAMEHAKRAPCRLHWTDNRPGRFLPEGSARHARFVTRQGHLTRYALACGYSDVGYVATSHGPGMWEAVITMPSPSAGVIHLTLRRLEPPYHAKEHVFRTPWAARRATMRLLLAAMLET